MNYQNMSFHNVEELEKKENMPGLFLQRYPKALRDKLRNRGRMIATQSSGCEIRFVNDDKKPFRLTIGAYETDGDIMIFRGEYQHSYKVIKAGQTTTFTIEEPERIKNASFDVLNNNEGRFSSDVWRVFFCRNTGVFYELDSFGWDIRAPRADELPQKTWLAYGSSITHGSSATKNWNSYVSQAAQRLHVDVLNKGMGGTCFLENEMADFFATSNNWDFATLELGINVRGGDTEEEFEGKVRYMGDKLNATGKPFAFISIYPNHMTYFGDGNDPITLKEIAFNEILKTVAKEKNIPLIDGKTILSDFSYLATDLIHPSDFGHMRMGENLANALRGLVI